MSMRDEANIITQVLRMYGAPCHIQPHPISYRTARDNVYVMVPKSGITIKRVVAIENEIEQALTHVRNAEVQVRWITQGRLALAVPRSDPEVVPIADMLASVKRSGEPVLTLGEHYDHSFVPYGQETRSPSWLRVNLDNPSTPHVLLAGTTGSGKTVTLKSAVLSLAVGSDPGRVAMVLIDPKAVRGLPGLEGLPHLAHPVVTDTREASALLASVLEEKRRRALEAKANNGRPGDWVRLVVVVDEMSSLISRQPEVGEYLREIAQEGRGLLIHLLLGTQKPTKEVLPKELVANVPARAVGLVATKDEAYYATGIAPTELNAHKLPGQGSFIFTLNGAKSWAFQSPLCDPEIEPRIVARVRQWWQHETPMRLRLNMPDAGPAQNVEPVREPAIATADERRQRHAEMIGVIRRVADENGDLPSSWQVRQEYQERFGVALNANTAKALLERAAQGVTM